MVLGTERCTRSSVRVIVQATAYSIMVLAALVLFGTAGVLSPASAQVKAPAKAKLKPPVKAVPEAPVPNSRFDAGPPPALIVPTSNPRLS